MKKTAVILVNLGSANELSTRGIRAFLREFLSDKRVVDFPRLLWLPILYGYILPFRPKALLEQYTHIWTTDGSPLIKLTESLAKKMDSQNLKVFSAMRYGNPSIKNVLFDLKNRQFDKIVILPLYPQYNGSTTASVLDEVARVIKPWQEKPELEFIMQYCQHKAYIQAISKCIKDHWQKNGRGDLLMFSFHGVPCKMIDNGDPYLEHCEKTVLAIVKTLELKETDYKLVFQSRFGKAKWLEPYCNVSLTQLPSAGIKHVDMVCPGFAVDCLETLFEINIENQALFKASGGQRFHYIPALNDSELHAKALLALLQDCSTSITLNK